jgi:hypothetical protein
MRISDLPRALFALLYLSFPNSIGASVSRTHHPFLHRQLNSLSKPGKKPYDPRLLKILFLLSWQSRCPPRGVRRKHQATLRAAPFLIPLEITHMPDTDQASPPAPNTGQEPPVPTETVPAPDAPKTGLEALTPQELAKMVKDLRSESAAHRTKLSAFEKAEEDRKTASLSELEKAHAAATVATEARAALEIKLARRDALQSLKNANVVDPDLAFLAIKDQIKIEDGEPMNIDDLVKEFVAARPQMVAVAAPQIPDTRSTNPPAAPNAPASGRNPGRI